MGFSLGACIIKVKEPAKGGLTVTEREIVRLLMQRDEKGLGELLIHYGPLMRYIIAPVLPNAQDREDCLSEVVMQVWKKIDTFDARRGSWNAWLTAVTRNHALNFQRAMSVHVSVEELPPELPSSEPGPEEQVFQQEQRELLRLALQKLSPKEKTLFYRKYYYMQSTAQIASEMGMTERAAEGRLYRIKRRLRKLIEGEGYE